MCTERGTGNEYQIQMSQVARLGQSKVFVKIFLDVAKIFNVEKYFFSKHL